MALIVCFEQTIHLTMLKEIKSVAPLKHCGDELKVCHHLLDIRKGLITIQFHLYPETHGKLNNICHPWPPKHLLDRHGEVHIHELLLPSHQPCANETDGQKHGGGPCKTTSCLDKI